MVSCIFTDKQLPVIGVIYQSLHHPTAGEYFCNANNRDVFVDRLLHLAASSNDLGIQTVVCRALCNAFRSQDGCQAVSAHDKVGIILATVLEFTTIRDGKEPVSNKDRGVRVAVCTLIMNYAVMLRGCGSIEDKVQCIQVIDTMLKKSNEPGSNFRLLVALGTIISGDDAALATALSLPELGAVVCTLSEQDCQNKGLNKCAKLLQSMLFP